MFHRWLYRRFPAVHRFDRWSRRRFTPAGQLALAGAIVGGAFGVNVYHSLAYEVFALCAALLLYSLVAARLQRPRLSARRELPRYCIVGVPLVYSIRIQNAGKRMLQRLKLVDTLTGAWPDYAEFRRSRATKKRSGERLDGWPGYIHWLEMLRRRRGGSIAPGTLERTLRPGQAERAELSLIPHRRGRLHFGTLHLLATDPLGLSTGECRSARPNALICLPRRYPVPRLQLSGRDGNRTGRTEGRQSHSGLSNEFLHLRDYRAGDPARHIHWPSYARREDPALREFEAWAESHQALLLDTCFRSADAGLHFEAAVSVAASLAVPPDTETASVTEIFAGSRHVNLAPGRNRRAMASSLLEEFAWVQAQPDLPFARLATAVRASGPASLFAVLLDWDAPRRELCRQLRRQGCAVLAVRVLGRAEEKTAPPPDTDYLRIVHAHTLKEDLARLNVQARS